MTDLSHDYIQFLDEIKQQIQATQIKVARAANQSLVQLYWQIGKSIVEKQEALGWGKSIVEQLAQDLKASLGGRQGFSSSNLWKMRQFYNENQSPAILQQPVAELPWGHHLELMAKVKDTAARQYYIKTSFEMGWSRNVLTHQIKSQAYERHQLSAKQHNFKDVLPVHLAEQADEAMKDIYMLDMLGITEPMLERNLELAMEAHSKSDARIRVWLCFYWQPVLH